MKKSFVMLAAALAFAACNKENNNTKPSGDGPVVEKTLMEESGKLVFGNPNEGEYDADDNKSGASETPHTYSWKMDKEKQSIVIDVNIDMKALVEAEDDTPWAGGWELGKFELYGDSFYELTGALPSALDESTFIVYNAAGEEFDMNSYKPGVWLDKDGNEGYCDSMFWQWYIWDGVTDKNGNTIGYDYDYLTNWVIIGTNPGNYRKVAGKTIVSNAKLTVAGKDYTWKLTVKFSSYDFGEVKAEAEDLAVKGADGYYSAEGTFGDHKWKWAFSESGLTVDVTAELPISAWGFMWFLISPDVMTEMGYDMSKLDDFEFFYPVDAEGAKGEEWTSYVPGQWVDLDGNPGSAMFWQYQYGDHMYDGHYTDGLMVIGTNPGNCPGYIGQTATSKAKIGEKTLTVNVSFVDEKADEEAGEEQD